MRHITNRKRSTKRFWHVLSMLVICSCLFSTNSYGGKKKMKPIYDINEAQSLKPQVFQLNGGLFGTGIMAGGHSNISLFPVPQDNTVGTNDMDNTITLISFPKGRISFEKHFKNAVNDIGGGGQYLPVISKDLIGFGQTRGFVIYDFKKKIHREFPIVVSLAKTIEKVAIADARSRHFIFEIEGQNTNSTDHRDISNSLQLMDLSGVEAKLIKKIPEGEGVIWTVVSDKNFLLDVEKKQVKVFDMNLEPAHHPLADVINQTKGKIGFTRIHAHPSLPFAILCAGKNDAMLVSWEQGKEKVIASVFGDSATAALQFFFSPDGKWVVFKEGGAMEQNKTYLMPVSAKYPNYLGSPILLTNDYFNDNKSTWTTNPISFVGSSNEEILRWDMENRDFPEKGKMSFHDYVVQEDLKKLTKEKRQGIGGKQK